jgi:dTDP-4-amino-4,6-dideoxygalactose transaminase
VYNLNDRVIPLADLNLQYRTIKAEVDAAVIAVLDSGQFVLGPAVKLFEDSFSATYGIKHSVGCSSGTAALHLALKALDIGRCDEVITTSMTFIATASAIDLAGATPVLVDIDLSSSTIDPSAIEAAITPRTRAIIPVHLYGQCADMDPILDIARKYGLSVIEDAAQAHGATYKGRVAGSMGDISCFSFYPGKNLGAYGEAGLVVTNDEKLAVKLRMLRDWGQERKYHHPLKGFNYRMDGVQGAILNVKMKYIEGWTERRRKVAGWLSSALEPLSHIDCGVELPLELDGRRHVWHVYGIRVPAARRSLIADKLAASGISTGLHYPVPVHLQPCFSELGYKSGDFPCAEFQANSELSLPIYPELSESDVVRIASALRMAVKQPG